MKNSLILRIIALALVSLMIFGAVGCNLESVFGEIDMGNGVIDGSEVATSKATQKESEKASEKATETETEEPTFEPTEEATKREEESALLIVFIISYFVSYTTTKCPSSNENGHCNILESC